MPFNYSKLKGKIKENYQTQSRFAKEIGLSERSLSLKLQGKIEWKQTEIEKACTALQIPKKEISTYFFTLNVQSA